MTQDKICSQCGGNVCKPVKKGMFEGTLSCIDCGFNSAIAGYNRGKFNNTYK